MEKQNLQSFVEARKHKLNFILTIIFFAFLLVFFLLTITEAHSIFYEERFQEFKTGLVEHAIPKGKFISNNDYDTTSLFIMVNDVVRYHKQILFALIISMIYFICQFFKRRFHAIPVVCAHIFLLSIFYLCDSISGIYNTLGLPHLWRMEIITFRGTTSLVLYSLLLASIFLYFGIEIRRFIENSVSVRE